MPSASASCSRATCRRPRIRRAGVRSTRAARIPGRTSAAAPRSRRCARSRPGSSRPATSPRSRCNEPAQCLAARSAVLGSRRRADGRSVGAAMDPVDQSRLRRLQLVGVASGFTAGAWLGAAEAPTKMVTLGIPPVVISLGMVVGVFLARWSLPALLRGTAGIGADLRQAPHLVVWAVLAGCLWAVANTLTIFAIRDIGLAIAFPLWNSNSLLGIVWGFVFFNELRQAGRARWLGVVGGALLMFGGAGLLAAASAGTPGARGHAARGVAAALAAGVLWGTMYIPYRKAYLTGMNPLSFITFFTVGELVMMTALAVSDRGGPAALAAELGRARDVLFWLLCGGFVWVVGDLFQQYAAKYVGISRGIPRLMPTYFAAYCWNRSPTTHTKPPHSSQNKTSRARPSSAASAAGPPRSLTARAVIMTSSPTVKKVMNDRGFIPVR